MLSLGLSVGSVAARTRRVGGAAAPVFPPDAVALWLILGQSNAEGYAPWRQDPGHADPGAAVPALDEAERQAHPWLRLSTRGAGENAGRFCAQGIATDATPRSSGKVWDAGSMGASHGIPLDTPSFGPEIGLVRHVLGGGAPAHWRDDADPRLFILKQTEGGRSVDHFRWGGPGQDLVLSALRRTGEDSLAALAVARTVLIQGVIFVIGEKDATVAAPSGASMAESLDVRFAEWVRQIRAALGCDAPVAFVEIHDAADARKRDANERLAALAASLPNAAVVARTPDWTEVGDDVHYDAGGQIALGAAAFAHLRETYGRPGDGLVTAFPFSGLKPWFQVPPVFVDDGINMHIAATPAVDGTVHAVVAEAGAPQPAAAAIRSAAAGGQGFSKAVAADVETTWFSSSGTFSTEDTQDCHFVLEDATGALGEVVTTRRWLNAKFAPDLELVSTSGGAARFGLNPKFAGTVSWACHAGARGFMRPEDVETAAFLPAAARRIDVLNNVPVEFDVTGLTPGAQYTLLATGMRGADERAVTQRVNFTAA
jgi:hypothetical protein